MKTKQPKPADQIRTAREGKSLTQAQVAELSGFSLSAISKFERGTVTPPKRSLLLVMRAIAEA